MGRRLQYKDYIIKSNPEPVAASGQWKLRIVIYSRTDGLLNVQPFSGPTIYETEQEADIHGIAYGQRIIDEKVNGVRRTNTNGRRTQVEGHSLQNCDVQQRFNSVRRLQYLPVEQKPPPMHGQTRKIRAHKKYGDTLFRSVDRASH